MQAENSIKKSMKKKKEKCEHILGIKNSIVQNS